MNSPMKTPMKSIVSVVETLLRSDAVKATAFLSDKQIVRATRRTFARKASPRDNVEMTLTLGRPNWAERRFLAQCKKAGEPVPVKKIQLKFRTVKKAVAKK